MNLTETIIIRVPKEIKVKLMQAAKKRKPKMTLSEFTRKKIESNNQDPHYFI